MIPCKPPSFENKRFRAYIPTVKQILVCNSIFRCAVFCKRSIRHGLRKKCIFGYTRIGNTKLFWSFKRLHWFKKLTTSIDKIPQLIWLLLIGGLSIMLAYVTLGFYTPNTENVEGLKSLISKGLLIAPLVNMLNSGNLHVLKTYRKAFGSRDDSMEPRFQSIHENYEFLSSILMLDSNNMHKKIKNIYLKYSRRVIRDSVKARDDIEYKNTISTIWIGILILVGYIFLFMGQYFTVSLVILFAVYISLIAKNVAALRLSLKQSALENLQKLLKEDYARNNIGGPALIQRVSIGKS